jgi:hypothetical protein
LQPDQNSRVLLAGEWLTVAVLFLAFMAYGFLPGWRAMNTDFPNYYLPAAIHHQRIAIDRAYEWRWFQRHKDHQQIDQTLVGFAPSPPLCAVPLLPLAGLPSLQAKRVWIAINLGFLALSLWLLHRVTRLPWRRILLLTFLCIAPLKENFLFGQYYVCILLLICVAYYAHCRGHRFTSGSLLAVAASLKIFPVFFAILFLRRRNWRALAGMAAGGAALAAISIFILGWNVHQIFLFEVLPRALHGEMVSPYTLQWNSLTAIWHRLFLLEPEMNPSPVLGMLFSAGSAAPGVLYALLQAATAATLLFSFLLLTGEGETSRGTAWEWATFLPMLLLMSSMPTAYHHCVLIFPAIVGLDFLLAQPARRSAGTFVLLFALVCFPFPTPMWLHLQGRLVALLLTYVLLLVRAPERANLRTRKVLFALAAGFVAMLTVSSLHSLRNRDQDFGRRVSGTADIFATFDAVPAPGGLVLDAMHFAENIQAYRAIKLPDKNLLPVPGSGDVLAIAASPESEFVYFEIANQRSQIYRLPASKIAMPLASAQYVADGEDPAISPDGHWLAFLREDHGHTAIWLAKDGASPAMAEGAENLLDPLEMTITNAGDIIAASGSAADPLLVLLHAGSERVERLTDIGGPVRYPAISPDGQRLAFSRRESGSWQLFVRDLGSGRENRFTQGACNAMSPHWETPQALVYVSDCGRGLALGAAARVNVGN